LNSCSLHELAEIRRLMDAGSCFIMLGGWLDFVLMYCGSSLVVKLIYTHYTLHSQQIKGYRPLFNAKSFRKCTHSERGGSHSEWTASLCLFSVPALWNSSPTAHHNDAILHSLKQPLCRALHSKMLIQKEGTCLVKVKYSNDSQKLFNFYGTL